MKTNKERVKEIDKLLEKYFSEINDFYEAKLQFIKEVNEAFTIRGDFHGIMCRTSFKEAFSKFSDRLNGNKVLENMGAA